MTSVKKFMKDIINPVDHVLTKLSIGENLQTPSVFVIGHEDMITVKIANSYTNTRLITYSDLNKNFEPNTLCTVFTMKQSISQNSSPDQNLSTPPFSINT